MNKNKVINEIIENMPEEMSSNLIDFQINQDKSKKYISTLTVREGKQRKVYIYSEEAETYLPEENKEKANEER